MPKKKFEEVPYDPIAADLAREVAATGRSPGVVQPQTVPTVIDRPTAFIHPTVQPARETIHVQPHQGRGTITKRFILTRGEDEELNAFLLRLQQRSGTKISVSVLARCALNIAMQAESQIMEEVSEGYVRRLPSTHDSLAQGEFEEQWTRCISSALRKASRLTVSSRPNREFPSTGA